MLRLDPRPITGGACATVVPTHLPATCRWRARCSSVAANLWCESASGRAGRETTARCRSRSSRPVCGRASGRRRSADGRARLPAAAIAATQIRTDQTSRLRRAADSLVAIEDFHFAPTPITAHEGETVTWPNQGPSAHTTTAQDGSFNTGALQKAATASHTFSTAGRSLLSARSTRSCTAPSSCSAHRTPDSQSRPRHHRPARSGSGAEAKPSSSTPSGAPSGTAAPTAAASAGPTGAGPLPLTGLNLVWTVLCGLGLIGAGLALRQPVKRQHD